MKSFNSHPLTFLQGTSEKQNRPHLPAILGCSRHSHTAIMVAASLQFSKALSCIMIHYSVYQCLLNIISSCLLTSAIDFTQPKNSEAVVSEWE